MAADPGRVDAAGFTVCHRDRSGMATRRTLSAERNQATARTGRSTAATDALREDPVGLFSTRANRGRVVDDHRAAIAATGATAAQGDEATGWRRIATAATDTLAEHGMRVLAFGGDLAARIIGDGHCPGVVAGSTGGTQGDNASGHPAVAAAAADTLAENPDGPAPAGVDHRIALVRYGHIAAQAAIRTGAAETDNRPGRATIATGTTDALRQDAVGSDACGDDRGVIGDRDIAAIAG